MRRPRTPWEYSSLGLGSHTVVLGIGMHDTATPTLTRWFAFGFWNELPHPHPTLTRARARMDDNPRATPGDVSRGLASRGRRPSAPRSM
jgi:hypothetical protein